MSRRRAHPGARGAWRLSGALVVLLALPAFSQHAPREDAAEAILNADGLYMDKRRALIARGWSPIVNGRCGRELSGPGGPPPGVKNHCPILREIDACGADLLCFMRFEHERTGRRIRITTEGALDLWDQPRSGGAMTVREWAYE